MKYLESPTGIEFLNSNLFPILSDDSKVLLTSLTDEGKEFPSFLARHSEPEISTNEQLKKGDDHHPPMKSSVSSGPVVESTRGYNSHNPLLTVAPTKKRLSNVPSVILHGRLCKFLADVSLLAGRTLDASIW